MMDGIGPIGLIVLLVISVLQIGILVGVILLALCLVHRQNSGRAAALESENRR